MLRLVSWIRPDSRGLSGETSLREALKTFDRLASGGLPVLDESGRAVGFLDPGLSARWLHRQRREGQVAEAIGESMPTLAAESTLTDALALMWKTRSHHLVGLDAGGFPVGVVTSQTILAGMLSHELTRDLMATPLFELPLDEVRVVHPEDSLASFLELDCEGAPVVDPEWGEPVGYISQSDVARMLWSCPRDLNHRLVLDAMTGCCHGCSPSASLGQAVEQMLREQIRALVVVENEVPVARLSALDVVYEIWQLLMRETGAQPLPRSRRQACWVPASERQAG